MTSEQVFTAVIADMDGVLTRTAGVHERAWREMFDPFLAERRQPPFTSEEYRLHVDGRPRYEGVAGFLASRGIELPRGEPEDGPERDTICGLGNRKNRIFLTMLARDGVEQFADARAALARWRRGGQKLAIISASRNCRRVLQIAGLEQVADVIVGGPPPDQADGKQAILREAALQLAVSPAAAVVLEDATSGVRAAQDAGFGLVVGVVRGDAEQELRLQDAGADAVVRDVFGVRFRRRLPDAQEQRQGLAAWRAGRPLALFLDFDGTLAPIVEDPGRAALADGMRDVLVDLAARWPVAVVSGRDRTDVAERVGLPDLLIAGNHGFDIAGPELRKTLPEAEAARGAVADAEQQLRAQLAGIDGVLFERKRFSVAIHYRLVASAAAVAQIESAVARAARESGLRMRRGKRVFELEPDIDWNKGRALQWILDEIPGIDRESAFVIYIGDDETDEDAFAMLGGRGAGIRVGPETTTSLADYRLADPQAVRRFLTALPGDGGAA